MPKTNIKFTLSLVTVVIIGAIIYHSSVAKTSNGLKNKKYPVSNIQLNFIKLWQILASIDAVRYDNPELLRTKYKKMPESLNEILHKKDFFKQIEQIPTKLQAMAELKFANKKDYLCSRSFLKVSQPLIIFEAKRLIETGNIARSIKLLTKWGDILTTLQANVNRDFYCSFLMDFDDFHSKVVNMVLMHNSIGAPQCKELLLSFKSNIAQIETKNKTFMADVTKYKQSFASVPVQWVNSKLDILNFQQLILMYKYYYLNYSSYPETLKILKQQLAMSLPIENVSYNLKFKALLYQTATATLVYQYPHSYWQLCNNIEKAGHGKEPLRKKISLLIKKSEIFRRIEKFSGQKMVMSKEELIPFQDIGQIFSGLN